MCALKRALGVIGSLALTAWVVLYLVAYVSTRGHPWGRTVDQSPSAPPVTTTQETGCSEWRWDPVARRWVEKKRAPRECDKLISPQSP
jgi:hypothetical protein